MPLAPSIWLALPNRSAMGSVIAEYIQDDLCFTAERQSEVYHTVSNESEIPVTANKTEL
jgi:hypothetical protein